MKHYQKQEINWNSKEINLDISFIIATYNEESTISNKLKNTLELDYPKDKIELVIIDSGSTDETPNIVSQFIAENPNLNVLFIKETERQGKTHAVNIAYPRASGEIKIISDADAILEKSALKNIVSNFNDPRVGAVCGKQILLNSEQNLPTKLEKSYRQFYEVLRRGETILDSTPIFHGELSAYRSDLITTLPENKNADDSRLANVVRKKGYRALYDSSAIFYEYAPPNINSIITQKVRRAQGLIRVFWDFKGCLFRKRYGTYGCLILPVEFLLHCIFPMLWMLIIPVFFVSLAFYNFVVFASLLAIIALSFLLFKKVNLIKKIKIISAIFNATINFLESQAILVYALFLWVSGRSLHKWKKVEDIRTSWREDTRTEKT